MRRNAKILMICFMLLIVFSGTISYAAISKPKNFRIVYISDKNKELESFEWSVYAVQQVFLDKLNITTYIDPKGYEYSVSGFRITTWSGAGFSGNRSAETATDKNSLIAVLRKAYDTLDPPYSIQASVVMKATGNHYSTNIPVHVIWLNQNSELVKETVETIGRDGYYTDKPPKYKIISVSAMMTDIWKIGSEITVNPKAPTVRYDKFAEEYKIVYRLDLTKEEEEEIMGLSTEAETEETDTSQPPMSTPAETETTNEETAETPQKASSENSDHPVYPVTDPAGTETIAVPTQTDESFRTGTGRTTLIIGLVIGIAVIYLIVITIGTSGKKKKNRRKNRL